MKKFFLWSFVFILCLSNITVFWATSNAALNQRIDQQNEKIKELENKLIETKSLIKDQLYDQYDKTVGVTNEIANKWLTYQTVILSVFSIILIVLWIILTVIVTNILNDVKKNKEEVQDRLSKVKNLKEEIIKIQEEIERYPDKLYQKILNKETEYIFGRLQKDPRDIGNFFGQLATREISTDYFNIFVDSWNKIHNDAYIVLSYQHMPANLFASSNDYWNEFIENINNVISSAFDNEINFSSTEILKEYLKQPSKYTERRKVYITTLINMNKLNLENNLHTILSDTFETSLQRDEFDKLI